MNNNNERKAISAVHTSESIDGQIAMFTRWEDTAADAEAERFAFEKAGCYFTKTFAEPGSCLGAFRVVGHKHVGLKK